MQVLPISTSSYYLILVALILVASLIVQIKRAVTTYIVTMRRLNLVVS